MKAIANIGLVFVIGAGLTISSRMVFGETAGANNEPRRVMRPTLTDAGPSLELASFGVAELTPEGGVAIPVLHVRAVVTNTTGDRPWVVDASRARLDTVGPAVVPAFINTDMATLPVAILDPGERCVIDLYFPLPADLTARGGPASFALSWPVNTPAPVVRHAWFERTAVVAQSGGDLTVFPGRRPSWWFNPQYPWLTYFHRPGYAVPRPPSYVIMARSPRWSGVPPDDDASADERMREAECDAW